MRKNKTLPLIAFAAANIAWGFNNAAVKIGIRYFPILILLMMKYVAGGIVLLLISFKKWKKIPAKHWCRIVVSTISGYMLANVFAYYGLKSTGAIDTSLIYLLAPILLFILSMEVLKERFNSKLLFGLIVGFLGAVLIVVSPLLMGKHGGNGNLVGNLLIILAVIVDVLGTILIKPVLKKVSPVQLTSVRFLISAVVLLPFTLSQLSHLKFTRIDGSGKIAILYNLIFATIIAYYLFHYGFSKLDGEQISLLYYLQPVAGVVGSIIILGEKLTTIMIAGSALILWGIYSSEIRKRTKHHYIFKT